MLSLTDRRLAKLPRLSRPLLVVAGVFLLLLKASAGDPAAEAFLRGKSDFERRAFAPALTAFEQALQDQPDNAAYLLWAGRPLQGLYPGAQNPRALRARLRARPAQP